MATDQRDQRLVPRHDAPQGDQFERIRDSREHAPTLPWAEDDPTSRPARIEHEIMRTRAELDETLRELRQRLSGARLRASARHAALQRPVVLGTASVTVLGVLALTVVGAVARARTGRGILGMLASAAVGAAAGFTLARLRR